MKKERIEYDVIDDLDQVSPAQTRTFRYKDVNYEIDLADRNHSDLMGALTAFAAAEAAIQTFVDAARVPGADAVEQLQNLVSEHRKAREAVEPLAGARNGGSRKSVKREGRATAKGRSNGFTNAQIREWAKGEGLEVKERGAIPQAVRDKFLEAKGKRRGRKAAAA